MPGSGRAQISELLFTLLLFFVQVGLPLIGVQPSFAWGILVWAIIAALSVHLFLQCEVWRRPFKILGPIVIVGIIGRLVWSPLKRQYNLEHPIVIAQKPRQGGDRGGPASKKATEEIPPPGELKKPRKTVQFSPKKKKEDVPAPVDKSIHIPSEKSIPIPILQPTPTSGPVVVAPDSVVSVNQQGGQTAKNIYNFGEQPLALSQSERTFLGDKFAQFAGSSMEFNTVGTASQSTRAFLDAIASALNGVGVNVKIVPIAWLAPEQGCTPNTVLFTYPEDRKQEADFLEKVFIDAGVPQDKMSACTFRSGPFNVFVFGR